MSTFNVSSARKVSMCARKVFLKEFIYKLLKFREASDSGKTLFGSFRIQRTHDNPA